MFAQLVHKLETNGQE